MKTLKTFCSIMMMIGFVFLLGTAGSVELGSIGVGRGILQLFLGAFTMGVSLFFHRVIWVSMRRQTRYAKKAMPKLHVVYRVPQEEKVC